MPTNEALVKVGWQIEISNNRYVTGALTDEMLRAIADRVMQNDEVQNFVNAAVEEELDYLFPELERETNEDGLSEAKVLLSIDGKPINVIVWESDLSSAIDAAIAEWTQTNEWRKDFHKDSITVISSEWVK